MQLLKKCPNCGRHFSVEVKDKELVETEHHTEHIVVDVPAKKGGLVGDNSLQNPSSYPVSEDVEVETETFDTFYECTHCHHKWKEESVKVVEGAADAKDFRG